ncbi:MAG TPA: isocitrate lyase/phosphoenolpyruvate mutase family protein [Acidobacteriaceae bacterium]|nr:isocitrate lyase/phosphoenolpyruvate mutase family protein [Acidobacteriaceae bacterium]
MRTQMEKGLAFRALHERAGAFVVPNPWDIGTARLLELEGFEALATTSAGCAFALGQPDNSIGREAAMAHVAAIACSTDLPVSGDLENGFGDTPEQVARTIRMAAAAGLVGGSIEDATGRLDRPIYDLSLARERVAAAVEAAHALPFPFMLTARAENFLHGRPDLVDTIERLEAYQAAGADVLYAPGLPTAEAIRAVVRGVDRPVNVLAGGGTLFSVATLEALGVKRISVGSALARTALGAFLTAAREMRNRGSFAWAKKAVEYAELNAMFRSRLQGAGCGVKGAGDGDRRWGT